MTTARRSNIYFIAPNDKVNIFIHCCEILFLFNGVHGDDDDHGDDHDRDDGHGDDHDRDDGHGDARDGGHGDGRGGGHGDDHDDDHDHGDDDVHDGDHAHGDGVVPLFRELDFQIHSKSAAWRRLMQG
ncbi:hypothetical protein NPIL_629701 [Nephila pilipes]|uniref:Uncharacterized protein n=1 Tax=Nephila pilipes TaxID=299642 RepID=A0A8X6QLD9_NEPPI|nr:hypothetical protein NPIL_629701 [Nephila pilipes]